jgi:hypothetical protein
VRIETASAIAEMVITERCGHVCSMAFSTPLGGSRRWGETEVSALLSLYGLSYITWLFVKTFDAASLDPPPLPALYVVPEVCLLSVAGGVSWHRFDRTALLLASIVVLLGDIFIAFPIPLLPSALLAIVAR